MAIAEQVKAKKSKTTRLYEVLHGQFGRKNADGDPQIVGAGEFFVPTPSELRSDGFRIRKTEQEVDWDSAEGRAALRTANMRAPECAGFGPDGFTGFAESEVQTSAADALVAALQAVLGAGYQVAGPGIRERRENKTIESGVKP